MPVKTSPVDSPSAEMTKKPFHGIILTLVIVSLLLNALCLYFLMGYSFSIKSLVSGEPKNTQVDSSVGIRRVLLDLEYEKVGGKENYDLLQKYSQMQIKDQIDKIKQYVDGGANPSQAQNPQPSANPDGTLSQEEIKAILADASIEGNKIASIIAIEYSDMECPFCMRQYHDTKLFPTLLGQYGDKVAVAFKNNRWVNHKGTEAKALGALCAGKLGGDSAYQKFYKGVMDQSTNEGGALDVSRLPEVAKASGVDMVQWQSCVDTKETLSRFTAQTAEAGKVWLSGTPGTLILNIKTGKYSTVEWAYPYTTFTAKIDALMN